MSNEQQVNNYYSTLQTSAEKINTTLLEVEEKNSVLQEKETVQLQLLADIENKEKLLLTRSRMLQIAADRNKYKKQLIYTSICSAVAILILIIVIFTIIRKK